MWWIRLFGSVVLTKIEIKFILAAILHFLFTPDPDQREETSRKNNLCSLRRFGLSKDVHKTQVAH